MFLARFNKQMVIGEGDTYSIFTNFDWNKFYWPTSTTENRINYPDLKQKLTEIPVHDRAKLICVGRNYANHAKELGNTIPKQPLLFWKPYSSLLSPHGKIILPPESKKVQHEIELVTVIGKRARNVSIKEAMNYILGYTIGLDITARDLQRADKTWFRGKSFDTFAPVGPVIVPKESIDLNNCELALYNNGELKQKGNTRNMIFPVANLIAYISTIVTLDPGDLIFTGTPEGVGDLSHEDVIRGEIEGIGQLTVVVEKD